MTNRLPNKQLRWTISWLSRIGVCGHVLYRREKSRVTTTDTRVYGPYGVLSLCTGNSARSIMAEAILNRVGRGAFHAYSAGSHPTGQVHPYTLDLLRNLDFDVSPLRSKSRFELTGPNGPELDFVFTVCDDPIELCPIWPGQPMTAQWRSPDPAASRAPKPNAGWLSPTRFAC